MAYEENVVYEAINVAYENKRELFKSSPFLGKNSLQFESAYGPRYPKSGPGVCA